MTGGMDAESFENVDMGTPLTCAPALGGGGCRGLGRGGFGWRYRGKCTIQFGMCKVLG